MPDKEVTELERAVEAIGPAGGEVLARLTGEGEHASIREFRTVFGDIGSTRHVTDAWQFILDSVTGKGGFADGRYLIPFEKELSSGGGETGKYRMRRAIADYDRFPQRICMGSLDIILSQEDSILRNIEPDDPRMAAFWMDADRQGNPILSVIEQAWRDARIAQTGWLVVDMPSISPSNLAEERAMGPRPYVYSVRSQLIPQWIIGEDEDMEAVVILEPTGQEEKGAMPLRVWTRHGVACFMKRGDLLEPRHAIRLPSGEMAAAVAHDLGICPVIPLHSERPDGDWFIAHTDMLAVARSGQTVYNRGSEAREVERKAALVLGVPVKDAGAYKDKEIEIGVESVLVYDSEAGAPAWVSPDFEALNQYRLATAADKESAYDASNLRGMVGTAIETTSGFHAVVEMSKTERTAARHAAAIEHAEKRVARVAAKFMGIPDTSVITISYPRKFAPDDADTSLDRLEKVEKSTLLGAKSKTAAARATIQILNPRAGQNVINEMVDEVEADLTKAAAPPQAPPVAVKPMLASDRLTQAIAAKARAAANGGDQTDE